MLKVPDTKLEVRSADFTYGLMTNTWASVSVRVTNSGDESSSGVVKVILSNLLHLNCFTIVATISITALFERLSVPMINSKTERSSPKLIP